MLKLSLLMVLLGTAAMAARAGNEAADEPLKLSETVDCGSVSQLDLFKRSRVWLAKQNPDRELLVADKETGDLVAAVNVHLTVPRSENFAGLAATFRYVITIECVNRKYRATISDVSHLDTNTARYTPVAQWASKDNKAIPALEARLKEVLADLQQNVKNYQAF